MKFISSSFCNTTLRTFFVFGVGDISTQPLFVVAHLMLLEREKVGRDRRAVVPDTQR